MSSYRSNNYIPPWQKSSGLNQNATANNKQPNANDRTSSSTNNRYAPRTSSYNSTSSTNSSQSTPTSTTGYQYRRTPSTLKKYANFNSPINKYPEIPRPGKTEPSNPADASRPSNIPRSRVLNNTRPSPPHQNGVPSSRWKEKSPEIIIRVSRATSPTPNRSSAHIPKKADDDVIISEAPRRKNVQTTSSNTQTESYTDLSVCRVALLTSKFSNSPNSPRISEPPTPRSFHSQDELDLSPHYCSLQDGMSRLSPNYGHPQQEILLRTPSPLANINNSLTNLTLEQLDDTDTENESSYEEDYPMGLEKDSYAAMSSTIKPPIYPPSSSLKPKNVIHAIDNKSVNLQDDPTEKNIPFNYQYQNEDPNQKNRPQLYPIRKMDSGELPWWQNSNADQSGHHQNGHVIRKIDATERPWWNKDSHSSESEDQAWKNTNDEGCVTRKTDSTEMPWWNKDCDLNGRSHNSCEPELESQAWYLDPKNSIDERNQIQGHALRKMDSFGIPWWCNSNDSKSNEREFPQPEQPLPSPMCVRKMESNEVLWVNPEESQQNFKNDMSGYKLRKFDSGERNWWAEEDQRSKSATPDWCRADSRDGDSEYIENYKSRRGYRITKIEQVQCENGRAKCEEASDTDTNDYRVRKIDSGEKPWWFENSTNTNTDSKNEDSCLPNEAQQSQETEEGNYRVRYINELENLLLYVGKYTNIDDLLGIEMPRTAAPITPNTSSDDEIGPGCEKIAANQVKIHDGSAYTSTIRRRKPQLQLDDAALQLYKDGDYSSYLDLDSSISEQQEEFEGFQPSRKDSIVVRTQLSVRVHSITEKLMKSEGRELRRALFSLKQIFQEDKDLVHEFVQNDGLDCLIKVGSDVDQNYQNYILRALGQVMLYVDGMNGVMEHNATIQWLYSLVSSKFRLVVKTVLKLLLVFVEYVESNCLLLIKAIHNLNTSQGVLPWSNLMRLLHEYDVTDTELLIYAMTLINKTLNGIPDQDMYYDQVDLLEEQDIESVIRKYMSKPGTDLDLLRQFQIYEAVLQHEDGEEKGAPLKQLDETIRKQLRNRKSLTNGTVNSDERRKSRRHSTGTTALSHAVSLTLVKHHNETSSAEEYRIKQTKDGAGVTPGLRKRRERAERQRSLLREQYQNNMRSLIDTSTCEDDMKNGINGCIPVPPPQIYVNNTVSKLECTDNLPSVTAAAANNDNSSRNYCNGDVSPTLKREATVKDITQKLASLQTPDETAAAKPQSFGRVEEMKGIISKAMEGLAKSQSRCDMLRSPTSEGPPSQIAARAAAEIKKSETDLHWEELLATSNRPLRLCDLDFSDLLSDDEHSVLAPASNLNSVPPPPPPCAAPPPVPSVPKAVSNKGKKTVKLFWKEVREDPIVIAKLNSKSLIWDEMYPVIIDTQRLEHLFESRAKDLITKKQHELNKNKEIIVLDPKRSNAINIGMTKLPPPRSIKTAILKMDSTVINREGIDKLLTMLPTEEETSKIEEAQVSNPDLPLGSAEHFLLTLASISELTARLKLWAFKLNYENIEKEIADPLMDLKQGIEVLRTNKTFRAILSTLLSIGIFLNGTEVKGFQIEYLTKVPEVKDTVHKHSLLHHLCHIVMEKFPDSTDLYSEIGAITRASRVDFDDLAHSIVRVEQECKASFDHLKAIAKHDGNTAVKLKLSEFLADSAERIIALGKIHKRVLNRFHTFCLWLGIPLHRIQATKPNELCKVISEFALEYRTTRERVIQQLEKKASHRERNKTRGKMITDVGKFRSKEDRQDAELRQLLGKEQHSPNDVINNNFQGTLPWRRLRKDTPTIMREQSVMNGHLVDAEDELLETLVKTATKTPAARNGTRERKRTRHTDRKSLRRTLKNGLTDEERNHLSTYIKSY